MECYDRNGTRELILYLHSDALLKDGVEDLGMIVENQGIEHTTFTGCKIVSRYHIQQWPHQPIRFVSTFKRPFTGLALPILRACPSNAGAER